MLMSIQLQPGILFDLRTSVIAIAAFFGGPVSAIIASVFAIACRWIIGGQGALPATIIYDKTGKEAARLIYPADWDAPDAVALVQAVLDGEQDVEDDP